MVTWPHRSVEVQVRTSVPADLLILDITKGEGFEKICPFLGIDLPREEFPHWNKGHKGGEISSDGTADYIQDWDFLFWTLQMKGSVPDGVGSQLFAEPGSNSKNLITFTKGNIKGNAQSSGLHGDEEISPPDGGLIHPLTPEAANVAWATPRIAARILGRWASSVLCTSTKRNPRTEKRVSRPFTAEDFPVPRSP